MEISYIDLNGEFLNKPCIYGRVHSKTGNLLLVGTIGESLDCPYFKGINENNKTITCKHPSLETNRNKANK